MPQVRSLLALAGTLMFLWTGIVFGAPTGSIVGTVIDKDGPLPGANVELTGGALTAPIGAMTDEGGVFHFKGIPSGVYAVSVKNEGADPVVVKEIVVENGKEKKLDPISLLVEEVQVEGQATQATDEKSSTVGSTLDTDQLQQLPTARSYTEVMTLAPGVQGNDGSGGQVIYGSTGLESSYVIDGINTTSVGSGLPSKQLNFDLIDKLEIRSGGYEAEYGGAQGAVVHVETKSGSNEYHGTFSALYTPPSLSPTPEEDGFGTSLAKPNDREVAGTLGGYLIKDHLFFFVGASRQIGSRVVDQRHAARFGRQLAEDNDRADLFSGKISWKVNDRHRLDLIGITDPRERDLRDELGGVGGDHRLATGGRDTALRYVGVISPKWIVDAQIGHHAELSDTTPTPQQENFFTLNSTRSLAYPSIRVRESRSSQGATTGALGEVTEKFGPYAYSGRTDGSRNFIKGSSEWFPGKHDIKVGLEYERGEFDQRLNYGWGTGMSLEYDVANTLVGVRRCWGDGLGGCLDWRHQVHAMAKTPGSHLFAQDRWQPTDDLTFNYGVRWERQDIERASGTRVGRIDNEISPRLGFTWDFLGGGRSKLYASAGRYYDSVPLEVLNRAFAPHIVSTRIYRAQGWTDLEFINDINHTRICNSNSPLDDFLDPGCWDFESADLLHNPFLSGNALVDKVHTSRGIGVGSKRFDPDTVFDSGSLFQAPIDRNLKGAHTDELVAGIDWSFLPNWTIGLRGIDRQLGQAIEDMSLDYGHNFIIANPGGPYSFYVDPRNTDMINPNYVPGSHDPTERAGLAQLLGCKAGKFCNVDNGELRRAGLETFPKATRHFQGLELTLARAASGRFWMNASYLYSRTRGNYRGRYFVESEERDPNLTEAFDVPALVVNTDGYLPQDRTHQVKVYGNWRVTDSFSLGSTVQWKSGSPFSATTDPSGGSTPFFGPLYLLARGHAGRTPNLANLDLNLTYAIQDKGRLKATIFMDLFNLLNEQRPIAYDEQFLASGMWRNAFYNFSTRSILFRNKGRGEPYDQYVDIKFGNGDGLVTPDEWNRWAHYFEGRFGSLEELYAYLRNETVTTTLNGVERVVPAYPGFAGCSSSLPSNPESCTGLNASFGQPTAREAGRSVRLGIRITF